MIGQTVDAGDHFKKFCKYVLDKRTWRGKYKGWAEQISYAAQILMSRVSKPKGENKNGYNKYQIQHKFRRFL